MPTKTSSGSSLISLLLGLFCLLANTSLMASEADKQTLVSLFVVDEPPASFRDSQGQLDGYLIDIVKAMQKVLASRDSIIMMPEQRALEMAASQPNVMLIGFTRTRERTEQFHMITPVLRKPWVLYARTGEHPLFSELGQLKALQGIGVVRGDVRESFLLQQGFSQLEAVARHGLNIKKLHSHRIEALFYEPLGMAHDCQRLQLDCQQFEEVFRMHQGDVYLMMSRNGTDPNLVRQWQQAATVVREQGTFAEIAERWAERIRRDYGVDSRFEDGLLVF